MNKIETLLFFMPLFVYLISFININLSIAVISLPPLLMLGGVITLNPLYLTYSVIASIIIAIKIKHSSYIEEDEIKRLEKLKKEKEERLNELKKTADELRVYEKKNGIIYSVLNILRTTTDIKHLREISKYIDDYLEAETSLYFISDETPRLIYGKDVNLNEKNPSYFMLELDDKNRKMFLFVIHSQDGNKLDEAKEVLDEIAPSLKKIFLFEMTENLSQRDGLTGLFRRGVFIEKINEEIVKARNFKHTVGLMMIDIDHFKHINDTYGHQVGDEVLKEVARIIKESVYETDFVSRYGGEEFAIIMPRAEIEGSTRKANYIREIVSSHRIKAGFVDIKVTISGGIAYYPYDASTAEDLIEKADKALYFSKKTGRNRITLYKEIKGSNML